MLYIDYISIKLGGKNPPQSKLIGFLAFKDLNKLKFK